MQRIETCIRGEGFDCQRHLAPDQAQLVRAQRGRCRAAGVGGAVAAPFAAWLVSKAPQRILGILVGNKIIVLNVRQLIVSFEAPPLPAIVLFVACAALLVLSLFKGWSFHQQDAAASRAAARAKLNAKSGAAN